MSFNNIRPKQILLILLPLIIASILLFKWLTIQTAEEDAIVETNILTIWDESREFRKNFEAGDVSKDENPQIKWAPRFFEYYLRHPKTKLGEKSLAYAFMMWGNTANADAVTKNILKVKPNSKSWSEVMIGSANAYGNSEKEPELKRFFRSLEDILPEPIARASLYSYFGRNFTQNTPLDSTRKYYVDMLELGYGDWYVTEAESFLYKIDPLEIGKPAPDISTNDLNGNRISLSNLKGKVVLLEFWAVYCGPCRPEIPYLKKVYEEYEAEDFVMIGVSLDHDVEILKKFLQEESMYWPQISQSEGMFGVITKDYNIWGIPKSYLIDKNGLIVAKNMRKEDYKQLIDPLL